MRGDFSVSYGEEKREAVLWEAGFAFCAYILEHKILERDILRVGWWSTREEKQ